jgi:predicted nuclease of predicted toxin-antitoxin system
MKVIPSKLLEDITFFVDRSSGKVLADGLKEFAGLNVERHDDHFPQNALDIEWLEKCGENNWVVISSDKAIKKNFLEKQALMQSNLASFFFTSASLTTDQQILIVSKGLKRIANILASQKKPFIARLDKEGKVEIWMNHKGEDLIAQKQERLRLKKQKSAE